MLACHKSIEANHVTAFEFAKEGLSSYKNTVVVKNETGAEVLFCERAFLESDAAHIPPHSWQSFQINLEAFDGCCFYVCGSAAGNVEIDMGSSAFGEIPQPAPDA